MGLHQKQQDKRPLIVVLTKYDAWSSLTGGRDLADDWVLQNGHSGITSLNTQMLRRLSDRFRGLIQKYAPEIVSTAEAFSSDVTYIPVSVRYISRRNPRRAPHWQPAAQLSACVPKTSAHSGRMFRCCMPFSGLFPVC